MRKALRIVLLSALSSLALDGHAAGERVSGTLLANGSSGGSVKVDFTCFGLPTCNGTFNGVGRDEGCSNSFNFSDAFTISGWDLSRPGPIQGTVRLASDFRSTGSGTCSYSRENTPFLFSFTGNWNGSSGTIVGTKPETNATLQINGTFSADVATAPAVFPMEVTANITPTVATASAQIQYRPQDVGTSASVFVFALAPATAVKDAMVSKATQTGLAARIGPKDDPVPCVLAQLNASGQLAGVSAATMQAYVSGVLGAQGQAVSILDNASTPAVAGATFFVGYGADANTMINGGVNRSALTVPGTLTCLPQPPQTGWWWNPLEGGRGFSIEVQGNNLFFAAFHYDVSGRATWNVSPGPTSLGGSFFSSDLYNVTGGQTLGGAYQAANATKVGPITLAFSDASHGTMTWPGGSVSIERQNLIPGGLTAPPQANVPETGWWWNPQESGRGFFIEWQKGYADIAGYMYDDNGNPVWYIAVYETPNARVFSGNWWTFANGQSMGGTYRAATRTSDNFAPLSINFTGPDTAVMTLPNGRTTNLVRQRF
jgi:hypothetical protein